MTTNVFSSVAPYTIAGTGPYAFGDPYFSDAELYVVVILNAVRTVLDVADYTVDPTTAPPGTTPPGGNITLTSATATTYAGGKLYIFRDTDIEQLWAGVTGSREKGLEQALDRLALALQDANEVIQRAVQMPYVDNGSPSNVLPVPEAGKILSWNTTADAVINGPDLATVQTLHDEAISAANTAIVASGYKTAEDWTALGLLDNLACKVGDVFRLNVGELGTWEYVRIAPAGTYVADGKLVRDLATCGYQAVSLRTKYSSDAELDADPRKLTSGNWSVASNGAIGTYCVVGAIGLNRTTTAGTYLIINTQVYANVLHFGAKGDGASDDTTAIQSANNTNADVYFPGNPYLISGTITPGSGGWYGQGNGSRGFSNTLASGQVQIKTSGSNGGTPFISAPPAVLKNIWFYGDTKTGTCFAYGVEGANFGAASNRTWKNVRISNFSKAIKGYNWFSNTWEDIWVNDNTYGIDISPTVTAPDGGYFTSTNWNNVYITDNDDYGLNINVPQGTKSFTGQNIVIENNNKVSGTAQCILVNVSWTVNGFYLEGAPAADALNLGACAITILTGYMNGTNGINLTGNNNSLTLNNFSGATATDILRNISATANICCVDTYLPQDLRSVGNNVSLLGDRYLNINHINKLSIGPTSASGDIATAINNCLAFQTTVSTTIPANSTVRVVTDHYSYGIWDACSHGIASVRDSQSGLLARVTPASAGSTHYFCVDITNTTGAPIPLSSALVNILFFKTDAIAI